MAFSLQHSDFSLSQPGLLLHGLDAPQIDPGNALRFKLTEIGERDRVDVILTNPPFGGEEEKGVQGNVPEDKQTAETALLFLQLIMRKLRRSWSSSFSLSGGSSAKGDTLKRELQPSRAAVVVPNGTLFGDGVCARIKEELLKEFNLHTIVRLPNGVFAPTPASRRTSCPSIGPGRRAKSGITNNRCLKAGRTTPKPRPSSSRNSRH